MSAIPPWYRAMVKEAIRESFLQSIQWGPWIQLAADSFIQMLSEKLDIPWLSKWVNEAGDLLDLELPPLGLKGAPSSSHVLNIIANYKHSDIFIFFLHRMIYHCSRLFFLGYFCAGIIRIRDPKRYCLKERNLISDKSLFTWYWCIITCSYGTKDAKLIFLGYR